MVEPPPHPQKLRRLAFVGLFIGFIGIAVFAFRGPLAIRIMSRIAETSLASSQFASLPDGLSVAFCGTGSPLPDPTRSGPCTAIIVGTGKSARMFVIDAGDGSSRRLPLMGLPPGRITAVLLSHFHSDHIEGLGGLTQQRWIGGSAQTPMPLVGPSGVEAIAMGFNRSFAADEAYRTAHHGAALAPPSGAGLIASAFAVPATTARIFARDGLTITAIKVDHRPVEPAVGYRFDYRGRCVVVSGDTRKSAVLAAAAAGCDLLVHEAFQPTLTRAMAQAAARAGNMTLAKIMRDIENYHTSAEAAAEVAQSARVKSLVLTHIIPSLRVPGLETAFLGRARDSFDGSIRIARDGDIIVLPVTGGEEYRFAGQAF